ncbi:MAG: SH3 domain-containing protein [Chloroflexi bacterium]|nr:SH3 domain-containing protein [Chloroflexota bacterium]
MRSGPSTSCDQIGTAWIGATYVIEGKNSDSSWLQVNHKGKLGWVSRDLVSISDTSLMYVVPQTQSTSHCVLPDFSEGGTSAGSAQMYTEEQLRLINLIETNLKNAGYSAYKASQIKHDIELQVAGLLADCAVPVTQGLVALVAVANQINPNIPLRIVITVIASELIIVGMDAEDAAECANSLALLFQ